MPIGAARSAAERALLLVSSTGFFYRLVHTSRTHRLGEGVPLDAESIGHVRGLQAFIEQLLCLGQHCRGQHRRPAPLARLVEPFRSLFAVTLHGAFEADLRHPEGAHNVRLLGIPIDAELGGDHVKGGQIVLVVDKHRHAAVEVGHPPILLAERQHGSDVRNALGEDRQLDL
jgi:hypothetical protein